MGKVNWEEAKLMYLKDSRISYSMLAKHYGVAKPTIQAHATKHGWAKIRKDISDERVRGLLASAGDSYSEFEARQLRYFNNLQVLAMRQLLDLNELRDESELNLRNLRDFVATSARIGRVLNMAIKEERLVLGIQYLPVRHPNDAGPQPNEAPEKIEEMPSFDEIIKDLEKKLKYFKRRKAMMEESQATRIRG